MKIGRKLMRKSMRKACAYDFAKSFLFLDKLQKWIYNFIKKIAEMSYNGI